ncbi:hypothetical protein MNBD_BACTEROID03-193 [hydrothermal vent metagenome]|uniref:Uncharacterized protein n=1 Tax=hydrothermal vent metagenome TaxID=652676 RepID=A0A3B0T371_9ZZZZ
MKSENFKTRLTNRVWRMFKDRFYDQRIADSTLVQNINFSTALKQKKAVISYLTTSYFFDWEHTNIGRTQPFEILSIAKVLADQGYCLDVIGCNDTKALTYLKSKKYDLVFGFGETFYQLTKLHPEATSILYMTEHHPEFSDREEKKRLAYFHERHNKKGRIVRSGNFYKPRHFTQSYTHVITMSEVEPFIETYKTPFNIYPTGVTNPDFVFRPKDHKSARRNFLWLGSFGAIHKGLDLLLDVFENRDDITLHIAGLSEEDKKLLNPKKRENIKDHDYIDIKSDTFLEIVNLCSYIILPSCSEGFSTAITTGMLHGLVPVVMKDTGFNRLGDHVILLDDYKISYIDKKLTELSTKAESDLTIFSKNVFTFAIESFLIRSFGKRFREIVEQILNTDKK